MITCFTCGEKFDCNSDRSCWCKKLIQMTEIGIGSACKCPNCLSRDIQEYLSDHPDQATSFWKVQKTQGTGQVTEGIDYHINEAGNWVFTAYYHLRKGYCCQNGCLYCPYGFIKEKNK